MKIIDVETRLVKLDMAAWYGDAGPPPGTPPHWEIPLARVSTDEGVDGFVTGYDTYGGGRMIAHLIRDQYRPMLLDQDPLRSEKIWHEFRWLNRHLRNARDAASGMLDVCLWDIRGKVADMPIGALLGLYRDRVPTYKTGAPQEVATPELAAEAALEAQAKGYRGFKLQSWRGRAEDVPVLRAAREATGDDFTLMVDSSGAYTFTEALEVGRVLEELGYHWFEEPIPDQQVGMLARLAAELRVPILAAETSTVHELPEYIRQGAIDMVRGDAYIKGGITGLRKALAMSELFGLDLEIHTAATPLMDVANLHVACSVKNCSFVEHHHEVFRFGLEGGPLEIDADGCQRLPEGPGLGVEFDWDWIEDHTIETI
jgi:L-alanine-DL-glutamate epimerase-like enolase superfamily enzyme